jgi:hypothetical protein
VYSIFKNTKKTKLYTNKEKQTMKKLALTLLAVLSTLVLTAALVPPVQAQMQNAISTLFGFSDAHGSQLVYDTDWDFSPYTPGYIPAELRLSASMTAGQDATEAFGLLYSNEATGRFVAVLQTELVDDFALPSGEAQMAGGRPARLQEGTAIDLTNVPEGKRDCIADRLSGAGVRRLTWNQGPVQIDLVSNLPLEEMLRIAGQMAEAPLIMGSLK